jgi:uncharacterized protein
MNRYLAAVAALVIASAATSTASANTPLIDAVKQQDAAAVRTLLQQRVDVNATDGDGSTALHWAAANGDYDTTVALLKAGASVKPVTRIGGMSPLFMAARHGDDRVVDALLKAGADAKEANGNGTTALMMAAASGNVASVKLLLDRGASVNATDATNGQTALMFAAARNSHETMKVLLDRGANAKATTKVFKLERQRVDADGNPLPPLPPAAPGQKPAGGEQRRGGGDRTLGATVIGGMTALHFAAREGHKEAVGALVASGADVNLVTAGEQTSPMVEAIINGHLDIARFLLESGASPKPVNIDGLTALYAVIDMRWRPNTWYPQPTVDEEQTNYLDLVTTLLDRGADVNARVTRKLWFRKFRYGDDWVEPEGATPFWRALRWPKKCRSAPATRSPIWQTDRVRSRCCIHRPWRYSKSSALRTRTTVARRPASTTPRPTSLHRSSSEAAPGGVLPPVRPFDGERASPEVRAPRADRSSGDGGHSQRHHS